MPDNQRSLAADIADVLAWLDLPGNPLISKRREMIRRVCQAVLRAAWASAVRTADTAIDSDQPESQRRISISRETPDGS